MLHTYKYCIEKFKEEGEVVEIYESFVHAKGLSDVFLGEIVAFEQGVHGQVVSVKGDGVEILVLSRQVILPHSKVAKTGLPLTVTLGEGILGHTLDAFGYAKDERRFKSDFPDERQVNIFPTGIVERLSIKRFMSTGMPLVDLVLPVGWGQRELIIGDRKTGKTHFLLQTVLNQAKLGRVCVYGAIGKRKEEIKAIETFFQKYGIELNTVIVAADSYDSPGEIFLAPYTAMTIAEYFRDKGLDVLLVLDDLTTHAKYYREFSLVGKRFPGRESYPGDVFHVHSKLLERAGCFKVGKGEASITCLPVAESMGADFTGYIQTNLMSITDGHLYFDNDIFLKGRRPAVNPFLSVTRVGRQTQPKLFRDIGIKLTGILKKHENMQRFLSFGQELGPEAKNILSLGDSLYKFFNQVGYAVYPPNLQVVLVSLLTIGYWNGEGAENILAVYTNREKYKDVVDTLVTESNTLDELNQKVKVKSNVLLNTK